MAPRATNIAHTMPRVRHFPGSAWTASPLKLQHRHAHRWNILPQPLFLTAAVAALLPDNRHRPSPRACLQDAVAARAGETACAGAHLEVTLAWRSMVALACSLLRSITPQGSAGRRVLNPGESYKPCKHLDLGAWG
jgi:hypothetical protein